MNDFSQLGFEDSHYEHTLQVREKAEIRKVAKYVGIAYLLCILIPEIIAYFIADLASSYSSLAFISDLLKNPIFSMPYQMVISVLIFVPPFFAVPMGLNLKVKDLVSVKPKEKSFVLPIVLIGLGFCAFANIAASAISDLLSSFGIFAVTKSYSSSKSVLEFIVTFAGVAIVPAITEEFAFRGIVLGPLRKFGDGFAILISALVFGLVHRNFVQIPFAFILGIVLAYATIKTGSILTSMIIHLLNNALSMVISTVVANIGNENAALIIHSLYFAFCFLMFFFGIALLSGRGEKPWKQFRTTHKLTNKQRFICFFSQPIMILNLTLTIFAAVNILVII